MSTRLSVADYEKEKALLTKLLVEEVVPLLSNALKEKKDTNQVLVETTDYLIGKGIKLPAHTIISCMLDPGPHHHHSRGKAMDLLVVGGCAHPHLYKTTATKFLPTTDGQGVHVTETVWGVYCG